MVSQKIETLLNSQIQKELYSAYLYMSFEAYFAHRNLNGFAHWFRVQAMEERDHALIFINYLNHVGGRVRLAQIDAPPIEFESVKSVFDQTLEHEQLVTRSIYEIVDAANAERDHKTASFLQWFVDEQAEEESNAEKNLAAITLIGETNGQALYMFDGQLAARVYTQAAPLSAGAM